MRKGLLNTSCLVLALAGMMQSTVAFASGVTPVLVAQPNTGSAGSTTKYFRDPSAQSPLTDAAKIALLRKKVKYVFVLFQENRAFDHYFGTYPGVDGLFSAGGVPNSSVAGFTQKIVDTDGSVKTISPFLVPRTIQDNVGATVQLYPEDIFSVDHSHAGMANGMHFNTTQSKPTAATNDGYALNNEGLGLADTSFTSSGTTYPAGTVINNPLNTAGVKFGQSTQPYTLPTSHPTLATKQKGEVVMAHVDCDTIPFMWSWADRFTLFDNFHQTTIGPSSPNAIAMIAGQTGETQWALHPSVGVAYNTTAQRMGKDGKSYTVPAFPVVADPAPYPGSAFDTAAQKPNYNPADENPNNPVINMTSATLPLSFMGNQINTIVTADQNPALDLADISHDITEVSAHNKYVNWAWYEQGYDAEPFDNTTDAAGGTHPPQSSYVLHHNGPQYFGYIADNTTEQKALRGLGDFYKDIADPMSVIAKGGVFYIRGGYYNNQGLLPVDPTNAIKKSFAGNDDHGSYSDSQISEAMLAETINAIANSPYWSQSAIVITYDETDGFYDHEQPRIRAWDPVGVPMTGGPRIPGIVISPYSAVHTISHQYSEHSSVIRFLDQLFNLVPLAQLPDEKRARKLGMSEFGQANLGPADDYVPDMGSLLEAFDNDRLLGHVSPLPASYATIPESVITSLPHYAGPGCAALNILPTDYASQADYANHNPVDPPPADFNPRPTASPGNPFLEQTTNASTGAVVSTPWTP